MYDEHHFQMKHFFLHDVVKFNTHDAYFIQKQDPCGAMGLFMIQKCIAIIRMLSYVMAIGVNGQICLDNKEHDYGKLEVFLLSDQGSFQTHVPSTTH